MGNSAPGAAAPSASSSRRSAWPVREGPGPRRGLTDAPRGVRRAAARCRSPRASSAEALLLPAPPSGGAPVEGAHAPQVHEAREQQRHEDEDLDVACPPQLPGRYGPGEDEDRLEVEDHEEERHLVELDRQAPRERPRRLDARLVRRGVIAVTATLAEQVRDHQERRGDHGHERGVQHRRPQRRRYERAGHATPCRSLPPGEPFPGGSWSQTPGGCPYHAGRPVAHMVENYQYQGERLVSTGSALSRRSRPGAHTLGTVSVTEGREGDPIARAARLVARPPLGRRPANRGRLPPAGSAQPGRTGAGQLFAVG